MTWLNALENVAKIIERNNIEKIVLDGRVVSRYYVFLVERDDKNYILAHPLDWSTAVAELYMTDDSRTLRDFTQDTPVVVSYLEAQWLAQGIFKCALRVK